MKSTSSFLSVDYIDLLKSLRTAAMTAASTFITASIMAGQAQISTGMLDKKQLIATCAIAGFTAVFDLIRRYFTNYAESK